MAEQKTVIYQAPVRHDAIVDADMFGNLASTLIKDALAEVQQASEGRAISITNIRLVVSDNGPSFIRGMMDAEIRVTVSLTDPSSDDDSPIGAKT